MLALRNALRVLRVPSSQIQALPARTRSAEVMSTLCLALSRKYSSCSTTTESGSGENKQVVVVGGGVAAGYMAKSFAEANRGSDLCILSSEDVLPYERPALSKGFLFKDGPARLPGFHTSVGGGGERQTEDWYKEKGIEVHLADPVASIDLVAQNVTTKSGRRVTYEKLVVAIGCGARRLDDRLGGSLSGVHYLRDHSQALKLYDDMTRCKRVVVIGGSFLALEAAAACAAWGVPVDVAMREQLVMQHIFPPELSQQFMDHFKSVYCLDGDGEIYSPWTVCFDLMHRFSLLPCAPVEIDARFSGHGSPPYGFERMPGLSHKGLFQRDLFYTSMME